MFILPYKIIFTKGLLQYNIKKKKKLSQRKYYSYYTTDYK